MDDFAQSVLVNRVLDGELGEPPAHRSDVVRSRVGQRDFVQRLHDRAGAVARSIMDRPSVWPVAHDPLDERLDEHVLEPARVAIERRTIALERWLAEHGFRGGTPIRFLRDHRRLHHHGSTLELPTSRPVMRRDSTTVDALLARSVAEHLTNGSVRDELPPPTRLTVVPGFLVFELTPVALRTVLALSPESALPDHVMAVGSLEVGPVLMTSRDIGGDRIAHALSQELQHELTTLGPTDHAPRFPSPAQGSATDAFDRWRQVDHPSWRELHRAAEVDLQSRFRHLPAPCRSLSTWSLSDLGFGPADWVPLVDDARSVAPTLAVASRYLATLLLGRTVLAWANEHPDERSLPFGFLIAAALEDCSRPAHIHSWFADQYQALIDLARLHPIGPVFLQHLYERIAENESFSHELVTPFPFRLHVSHGPLHLSEMVLR